MSNVLIVDDSVAQRCALERGLERSSLGIEGIRTTTTAAEALELLDHESFDIVMCGATLPDRNGIDLLEAIASRSEDIACVLLTSLAQGELVDDAKVRGVRATLPRPFDQDSLVDVVGNVLGS